MSQIERVYVAVDVSNVWKSCRLEYGEKARVDFRHLARLVPATRWPQRVTQTLVAYIVTNPHQNHKMLYRALRGYGFTMRERFMRHTKDKPFHTDWDVGITIDALHHVDEYDTFVLVSGDGDFSPLLRHLKLRHGKETMVYAFDASLARQLYTTAGRVITLTEDAVYQGL